MSSASRTTTAAGARAAEEIRQQIMWNRLLAIVEEQGQALVRTAFSSMVRECGDLSAGVFDERGRMLAQAVTGTPGHVNTMAESVRHFMERFPPDDATEGDSYLTNDPWLGTGHLNDFVVVAPIFHRAARVGYVACTSHLLDVGGIGFGPDGTDVYMEGISIPPIKLTDAGVVNAALISLVKANSRLPVESEGDIYSLLACCETGSRRVIEMMEEFSIDSLGDLSSYILERSEKAVSNAIAELPNGHFDNEMTIDGYDEPVTLKARVTVGDNNVTVDFSGSSAPSTRGINVPLTYTKAYASFALACAISPGTPNNSGSLRPYQVTAPENTIVNAVRPHAVAVRHIIGQMLPDVVFGCLRKCVPDRVPAEGTSSLWNIILRSTPSSQHPFMLMAATNGGTGARPCKDGLSATAFPSGVKGTPVEILESTNPVIVWRKDLRSGSGGAGKYRGGLGQHIELGNIHNEDMELLAAYDRIKHPARGVGGGQDGAPGFVGLASGAALNSKGTQRIAGGTRLVIKTPGGAGIGEPSSRNSQLIAADVKSEFTEGH